MFQSQQKPFGHPSNAPQPLQPQNPKTKPVINLAITGLQRQIQTSCQILKIQLHTLNRKIIGIYDQVCRYQRQMKECMGLSEGKQDVIVQEDGKLENILSGYKSLQIKQQKIGISSDNNNKQQQQTVLNENNQIFQNQPTHNRTNNNQILNRPDINIKLTHKQKEPNQNSNSKPNTHKSQVQALSQIKLKLKIFAQFICQLIHIDLQYTPQISKILKNSLNNTINTNNINPYSSGLSKFLKANTKQNLNKPHRDTNSQNYDSEDDHQYKIIKKNNKHNNDESSSSNYNNSGNNSNNNSENNSDMQGDQQ